jgi:type IV secretory pathway ATPase VirB11/archaellum biosynthesis ATPase
MLASTSSYDSLNDVRIHRFNDALDKFLELIDERATNKNFQTALPHLDANLLDGARKQFVFHLKDAIKVSKTAKCFLVNAYTHPFILFLDGKRSSCG